MRREDGTVQAAYTYDAWGKILSIYDADDYVDVYSISHVNPFRYRGYVYDQDTKLYYCQSRYYDPQIRRFINSDDLVGANNDVTTVNLFTYCGNNPTNRVDIRGHFWSELWDFAKTAVTEIGNTVRSLAPAYAGCGAAATVDGPIPIGDIIGLAGATLLTAGAVGYGIYRAATAPAIAIPKVEVKEITMDKRPDFNDLFYGADLYGGKWKIVTDGMTFEEAFTWVCETAASGRYGKNASWGLYIFLSCPAEEMARALGGFNSPIHEFGSAGQYNHYHVHGRNLFGKYKHFHVWYGWKQ